MTKEQSAEFDRQLAARGWTYDPAAEEFRDGPRLLEWEDVIGLVVPGLSLDDLAAYQDAKYDDLRARH
jgi:hypothetical protein